MRLPRTISSLWAFRLAFARQLRCKVRAVAGASWASAFPEVPETFVQSRFDRPLSNATHPSARTQVILLFSPCCGPIQLPSLPLTWHLKEGPLKRKIIFQVPSGAMLVEGSVLTVSSHLPASRCLSIRPSTVLACHPGARLQARQAIPGLPPQRCQPHGKHKFPELSQAILFLLEEKQKTKQNVFSLCFCRFARLKRHGLPAGSKTALEPTASSCPGEGRRPSPRSRPIVGRSQRGPAR